METETLRVGFCSLLGLPNVGKSTLLNQYLQMRLVAVSPRPQTTRNRVIGVVNLPASEGESEREGAEGEEAAQIIFVDTPGVQQGPGALRRYMQAQALAAAGEGDVAVLLIDASDPRQRSPESLGAGNAAALAEAHEAVRAPLILALNKIDRLGDKGEILPIIEAYHLTGRYAEVIPISALTGDGLAPLRRAIVSRLPRGPRLFPEEMVTDRAERFLAAELIREQLFCQLGQEVPYATAVVVESFEERAEKRDVVIAAAIHVERESQKPIVIGKGGQRIKQVGADARAAISELLGCPVHVKLFVKVTPNWSRGARGIREMGYE